MWETCDHQLGAFSPDGRYVVGLAPYFDGLGSPSVGDPGRHHGRARCRLRQRPHRTLRGSRGDVVWEDATTLLATVTQGVDQYVVRATIDGRVERVAGPRPTEMSVEYRFATPPFG